ncbi:helix-turn-helix domain-containing protein [Agromyces sp. NPDC060279]|uniref:helix-turn-helix domain-containing protein n=1 Tax=Agromyces sp. NPDC060279 TaxID=3347092 RepID=UPI003662804B
MSGPQLRIAVLGDREPLWRAALGAELRRRRAGRGESLAEAAARAGVSSQYLSELERGRKEASSEVLAALARSYGVRLAGLLAEIAAQLDEAAAIPVRRAPPPGAAAPSASARPRRESSPRR